MTICAPSNYISCYMLRLQKQQFSIVFPRSVIFNQCMTCAMQHHDKVIQKIYVGFIELLSVAVQNGGCVMFESSSTRGLQSKQWLLYVDMWPICFKEGKVLRLKIYRLAKFANEPKLMSVSIGVKLFINSQWLWMTALLYCGFCLIALLALAGREVFKDPVWNSETETLIVLL